MQHVYTQEIEVMTVPWSSVFGTLTVSTVVLSSSFPLAVLPLWHNLLALQEDLLPLLQLVTSSLRLSLVPHCHLKYRIASLHLASKTLGNSGLPFVCFAPCISTYTPWRFFHHPFFHPCLSWPSTCFLFLPIQFPLILQVPSSYVCIALKGNFSTPQKMAFERKSRLWSPTNLFEYTRD